MLEKILIGVAGVLVLFVAVVATRRSTYHVERKLEVAAPADLVFGVLNDLHQFAGVLVLFGSPWETLDPNMRKTFEGPAAGVGQSYAWSGKKVGKGKMTIRAYADRLVRDLVDGWEAQFHRQSLRHVHGHGQHARRRHREGARPAEVRRRRGCEDCRCHTRQGREEIVTSAGCACCRVGAMGSRHHQNRCAEALVRVAPEGCPVPSTARLSRRCSLPLECCALPPGRRGLRPHP